ncbi:MAG: preprotein translocase subunit SecE [Clostridia bacterium]|nr:preprotein translocase subunit SecE [Clostridia bacterium]
MPEIENKPKRSFMQNMKTELKKVVWPSSKQVSKSTVATISFVLLIAVILALLNWGFSELSNFWWKLIIK